jgi:superfamily II DNA or RNA helicase
MFFKVFIEVQAPYHNRRLGVTRPCVILTVCPIPGLRAARLRFESLIFCQPHALHFSGQPMHEHLVLPDRIAAGHRVANDVLDQNFALPSLRPADVPLAFHRESPGGYVTFPNFATSRTHQDMTARLEILGRIVQYRFSDGVILNGNQILYHPYAKMLPRHLLPLTLNVKSDLQDRTGYGADASPASINFRPVWQIQAEHVILSLLFAAQRAIRQREFDETDTRGPENIFITFSDDVSQDRPALKIKTLELVPETWSAWRVSTALPETASGVYYGRARLEINSDTFGNLQGLTRAYLVDCEAQALRFHGFEEQLSRLKLQIPKHLRRTDETAESLTNTISLHLSGHAHIQATLKEIEEMLAKDGAHLQILPRASEVTADKVKPKVALTGDGSFRFVTRIELPEGHFEAHGIPQSSSYILTALQSGLSAVTVLGTQDIAHSRRGIKRERDLKVLRNLGFSALVFFDAASYALGLPVSDGTVCTTERELCDSIFARIGALILKSEGWPVQTGSVGDLCSKSVTTLIESFVAQIVADVGRNERDLGTGVKIYLPQGEFNIRGLSGAVIRLFHAIVGDLAIETNGGCFSRARTKYFETFTNGRSNADLEDIAVRGEVSDEHAAKLIYQPGVGERYILPESTAIARSVGVLSLITQGFEVQVDGKAVEQFDASDFKPEFSLREQDPNEPDSTPIVETAPLGARKIDWFELSPKFFFKGTEITGEQASRLSREGMIEFQGKLYRVSAKDLPSLKRLTKFWSSIQSNSAGLMRAKRRKTEDTYFQLPRSQTLELLALRATGVKIRGGPIWDEITKFYDTLNTPRPDFVTPDSFKAKLQPYQTQGTQWLLDLYKLGLGGILADDMGLGKTVTSLAFLEQLRVEERMGPCLILVPTSLTYNWLSESEKFTPQLPITIFSSRAPEATLDFVQNARQGAVICTYGLLQENSELFQQVEWNIIIFDEAQNLKNITTKRTTAARKLRASFKLCLTGTPLENHYGEFFSLFDLIVPGALGELAEFREKYVNPPRVLREDIDFLKLKSKPLLLRRTKSQVMSELPDKIETTIKLPFDEDQKRIYRDIASSYNEQIRSQIAVHGESKVQLQMLTALLRLRQACSDPAGIPGVKYVGEPPKVSTLVEALHEIIESGASALVFTQFLTTFDRIKTALTNGKIQHFDICGADSRVLREKKLRSFQESENGAVMLMTLKTGGVGLNLTKASYVFHIEPWWNPAVENQATDRAHRIGQAQTVQVYRYLIKESVEEKIEVLKAVKAQRFDALFSTSEGDAEIGPAGSALSQRDFEFLLS